MAKGKPGRPKLTEAEKAARKAEREAKKANQSEQQTSSPDSGVNLEFKKPTSEQVAWLIDELETIEGQKGLISESAKEIIDNAVENKHFDKKALAMVRALKKQADKSPEKFAITLPHLLSYIDDLHLAERANQSRGLRLDDEDSGDFSGDFVEGSEAA